MECPKGLPVGQCCAIQKTGAVFVQEINACRDAVKRVAITKSAEGGQASMATSEPVNIRKVAWDLIQQTAANLRRERAGLTQAEATVKACEMYPRLYELYVEGMRRGDPPSELAPAPVAKRAPSEREQVFETIMKRASALAAEKGITPERALVDLTAANPGLYQQYLDAKP